MKKNILFIGGSSGIGYETIKLIHNQHNIYVGSRSNDNFKDLNVNYIKYDVLNEELNTWRRGRYVNCSSKYSKR